MLKKAVVVAGAAAGMLALAPAANADSADNDGINLLNDNNIQANIPVCGNDIPVLSVPVNLLSPSMTSCETGDINDHTGGSAS